jgi:hypothetical protein
MPNRILREGILTSAALFWKDCVFIPEEVCSRRDLRAFGKICYGVLTASPGASLAECAAAMGVSENRIRRCIGRLRDKGLLAVRNA